MAELSILADVLGSTEETGLNVSGGSGTFTTRESLYFQTSGAVGEFISENGGVMQLYIRSGLPQLTETIEGVTSTATRTLDSFVLSAISFSQPSSGGDTFQNDEKTHVFIQNGTSTAILLRIPAQRANSDGRYEDWYRVIPPMAIVRLGPFRQYRFNDSTGRVTAILSNTSSQVGIAIHRIIAGRDLT